MNSVYAECSVSPVGMPHVETPHCHRFEENLNLTADHKSTGVRLAEFSYGYFNE